MKIMLPEKTRLSKFFERGFKCYFLQLGLDILGKCGVLLSQQMALADARVSRQIISFAKENISRRPRHAQ